MSVNKLNPEKIQILDFKIIEGKIESPFEFEVADVKGYNFSVDFETAFNIEDKLVKADFKVSVETLSDNKDVIRAEGKFHFVYIFGIENIHDLITTENKDKSSKFTVFPLISSATKSTTDPRLTARETRPSEISIPFTLIPSSTSAIPFTSLIS